MALPAELEDDLPDAAERAGIDDDFDPSGAIVPAASISGRALFFVLAIMSFLACITVGSVAVIATAAADWRSDISGEITVQVRPLDGVDVTGSVASAIEVIRATPGVESANVMSDQELRELLEPWLGGDVDLEELPVPRLIVVGIDRAAPPDTADLRHRQEHVDRLADKAHPDRVTQCYCRMSRKDEPPAEARGDNENTLHAGILSRDRGNSPVVRFRHLPSITTGT